MSNYYGKATKRELLSSQNYFASKYCLHSCSLRCCSCGSCGVLLLLFPQVLGEESFQIFVGDGVLASVLAGVESGSSRNDGGASGLHNDGGLELSDEFSFSLREDGVGHEHVVVDALADTDLGSNLVLHGTDGERQGGESFVDLNKEFARALHLQVVDLVELALINGAARGVLAGLSLASRHEHVEADDVARGELPLGNLLGARGLVDDNLVTVDNVPLHFVREDALNGVALELLSNFLDDLSNGVVSGSLGNLALGGLESVPSGKDDIGLAASDGTISNDHGRGGVGSIAVNVGTADTTIDQKVKYRFQ